MAGVTFLPIQQGTGDPSPSNVRPISPGLTITGIGDIYGGYLDVAHGTVVETWRGYSATWADGTNAESLENDLTSKRFALGFTPTTGTPNNMCNLATYSSSTAVVVRFVVNKANAFALVNQPTDTDSTAAVQVVSKLDSPITHSLTSAQLAEAMRKLGVQPSSMLARRRRLVMAQPHLSTPTPANPVSFSATLAAPLKELACAFSPVQAGSGDPSPNNVRAISGWTGANVVRCGKNLLDPNREISATATTLADMLSAYKQSGVYGKGYYNATAIVANASYVTTFTPCKAGATYTIKNTADTFSRVGFLDDAGEVVTISNAWVTEYTHTALSNEKYIVASCKTSDFGSIQLELGSPATSYAPYTGQTLAVQFPATKNLCKLQYSVQSNAWYKDLTDNSVTVYASTTSAGYKWVRFKCADISALGGKSVTFSCKAEQIIGTTGKRVIGALYLNGTKVGSNIFETVAANVQATFTIPANVEAGTEFDVTCYCNSGTAEATEASFTECQLELGSTATPYEPYGTIYGGYIDPVRGVVRAEWAGENIGSMTVGKYITNYQTFFATPKNPIASGQNKLLVISSGFKGEIQSSLSASNDNICWGSSVDSTIRIKATAYAENTPAEFKTAFADTMLVYQLATPIEYPIAPSVLKTLKGANVIYTDLNGNVSPTYWTN